MNRKAKALSVFIMFATGALAQCDNGDFESNTFDNWVGYIGDCCPAVTNDVGIVPGRHTLLTNKNATDPRTFDKVKLVCPQGGNVSVQLGNANIFAQAERLRYRFVVSPDNALFSFRYAVVLDDAGHDADNQPRFEIRLLDQFNDPVPCGNIKYIASANLPGFFPGSSAASDSSMVVYRNWSTELVDLRGYIGQMMTLDFITNDCGFGGHFGYGYIDGVCEKVELKANDFCKGDTAVTLTARDGFYDYFWSTGDTTQIIQYPNPKEGDSVWVRITPTGGASCSVTLGMRLKEMRVDPGFIADDVCLGDTTFFNDTSLIHNASQIASWQWNFGDGNTADVQNPRHLYTAAGTYTVGLTLATVEGCSAFLSKTIRVHEPMASPVAACDSVSYNKIRFRWTRVKNAAGYQVSLDKGNTWTGASQDTVYQVANLNPGDSVTLMVKAIGTVCGNTYSSGVSCKTPECPAVTITLDKDTTIFQGDTAWLKAIAAGGSGSYTYSWDPVLGIGPGPYAVSPQQTTSYTVRVQDITAPECPEINAQAFVTVQPKETQECKFHFHMPNAFSPNYDQFNDELKATGSCIMEYNIVIFNRWGERIFVSSDFDKGWNGGLNNNYSDAVPVGAYVYLVRLKDDQHKEYSYTGTVSLMR